MRKHDLRTGVRYSIVEGIAFFGARTHCDGRTKELLESVRCRLMWGGQRG